MRHARADQKRYPGAGEAAHRCRERKCARAAISGVLFGQPQRVHREVGAADAEEEQARQEVPERVHRQIEDVAEPDRDRREHQREIHAEREPPAARVGERGESHASEYRAGRQQHRRVGSHPRRVCLSVAVAHRNVRHRRGHIDRTGPQAHDRNQEVCRIEQSSPAIFRGKERRECA